MPFEIPTEEAPMCVEHPGGSKEGVSAPRPACVSASPVASPMLSAVPVISRGNPTVIRSPASGSKEAVSGVFLFYSSLSSYQNLTYGSVFVSKLLIHLLMEQRNLGW